MSGRLQVSRSESPDHEPRPGHGLSDHELPDHERCLDRALVADPRHVRPMAAEVRARLADRLGPDHLDDLEQAVAEVLANAVEHGSRPGDPVRVQVDCADTSDGIEVVVRVIDTGRGAGVWPRPARAARTDLDPERGRGRDLVARLVDEVADEHTPDGHVTALRLRRPEPGAPDAGHTSA